MNILRALLLACAVGLSALPVAAQSPADAPQVEVTIDPPEGATVGTPLSVTLSVLAPNYLLKAPVWPDLQIADAITRVPPNASRPGSRRIGGQTWVIVSRVYEITPQRAADYTLDPQKIPLTYADPETNQPVPAEATTPAITFSGTVPKGAEGLKPFVAAEALTISDAVEGPGDDPRPGSAVTRTVTIAAQGTQAMLLPPILGDDVPAGLRAYPREPELSDQPGERGAAPKARRVESVTYVAELPGDYTLPPLRLDWWNSKAGKIESAESQGASFSIPAPPGWHPPGTPDPRRVLLLWVGGITLAILAALWLGRHRLRSGWAHLRRSEPVVFRRMLGQARHGHTGEVRRMLGEWRPLLGAGNPPASVETALRRAERELWGPGERLPSPSSASRKALVAALREARRDLRHRRHGTAQGALPPLNPW